MMSYDIFYTLFLAFVVWSTFRRDFNHEKEVARTGVVMHRIRGRVTSMGVPLLLPGLLLIIMVIVLPMRGFEYTFTVITEISARFMLMMSIYYAFLLIIMPIFRKIFSARACAYLWILPAALYNFIHIFTLRSYTEPKFILKFPPNIAEIAIAVWLIGFVLIMTYIIVSHLQFRKEILTGARRVTDEKIRKLWSDEQDLIERRSSIPLLISDKIASPMTIGVWDGKLRTVLPTNNYTLDELQLIFRHELRHIQRQDGQTKAFLSFYRAFCWFNPLVWLASKKASEDMELSCDEIVLYNADENKRRKYAELLLDTAGDSRGFSTCLSAAATTLQYRLKNAIAGRKRLSGALLMAVAIAVVMLGGKVFAVSFNHGAVKDVILGNCGEYTGSTFSYEAKEVLYKLEKKSAVAVSDEEKLQSYVESLSVSKIGSAMDGLNDAYKRLYLSYNTEKGYMSLRVIDNTIEVNIKNDSKASGLYIIEDEVDWELIESCMDFTAEDPDPAPVRPTLSMFFDPPLEPYEEALYAEARVIRMIRGSEVETYEKEEHSWNGVHGIKLNKAFLEFNYAPEDFLIEIEGMNGEGKETIKPNQLGEGNALALKPYYARYTVYGTFKSHRNTTYEMAFYFEINPNQR